MDRVVTIYINREQEAVVVKARSPPAGGGGDGAREASQSNEKFPKCHRKHSADP